MLGLIALLVSPGYATPDVPATPELRTSPETLLVRSAPTPKARTVGRLAPDAPFLVMSVVTGPGCSAGWGVLEHGYTCLLRTSPTDARPAPLPTLVAFDPPTPAEYRAYLTEGTWPREPDSSEALLPYVYGKAWRRWKGKTYASVEAWDRGDPPVESLASDRKYHFVDVIETSRGAVLVRHDGRVAPLDDVFLYPVSRFAGVELDEAAGMTQAWTHPYANANLRDAPSTDADVYSKLPQHTALRVRTEPATPDGAWFEVPDARGPGLPAYIAARVIRRVVPAPPPASVTDDELWIDVDLQEQVLMLLRGPVPVFATLISSGLPPLATPKGTYAVLDKAIAWDMASLPGVEEPYHVERVPWVVHFRPRYAIHGVFWHWGFGNRASHGCINLSPADARHVFDAVTPTLPASWSSVTATGDRPGTTLRVR